LQKSSKPICRYPKHFPELIERKFFITSNLGLL
jgi:hypothetical protein